VHDAVSFEVAGLPSVCLVSSAFVHQAQYQANMLNLPDVRVSFLRHPISDATSADLVNKTEECYDSVVQAISVDSPLQLPAWLEAAPQGCSS